MEVVTQWLGRIGIAVRSKIQQIVGRASLRQSRALLTHKLASDDAQPNVFEPLTPVVMSASSNRNLSRALEHVGRKRGGG